MISALLGIFLLLIHCQARSEILFIDINSSPTEVASAREAAKLVGETVLVVPGPGKDLKEDLLATLKEMHASKRPLTSLIISGHYSKQQFQSEDKKRSISYSEITQIFRTSPFSQMAKETRHLLLWGCYTARPRAIANWQGLFPELLTLSGFSFAAPNAYTDASTGLIKDILVNGYKAGSSYQLERSIGDITRTVNFLQSNAVIVSGGCYYSTQLGNLSVSGLSECPPSLIERLIYRRKKSFDPYEKSAGKIIIPKELREQSRSHGENGLYRFKVDSVQYGRCFESCPELPDPARVSALCSKYSCD